MDVPWEILNFMVTLHTLNPFATTKSDAGCNKNW